MKSLFFAITIALAQFSFAGPEDRLSNNCFEATSAVPQGMSNTVCYEKLTLDVVTNKMYPGASVVLPTVTPLTDLIRQTEDVYSFSAEPEVMRLTGAIDETSVTLIVSGKADFTGDVDESTVKMKAQVFYTNDYWHLEPRLVQEIEFVRVK